MPGQDFVFKIAEKGTPVRRAADYQLGFSSKWPVVPMLDQGFGEFALDDPAGFAVVTSHKLGYFPVFFIFLLATDGTPQMYNGAGSVGFSVDEEKLYVHSLAGVPEVVSYYWYVSYLPLTKQFSARYDAADAAAGIARSEFVARFALPGRSARSHSQEDFTLHTDSRPFMVQMIEPVHIADSTPGGGGVTNYDATIQTPFNYYPVNIAFAECGDDLAVDGTGRYQLAAEPFLIGATKPGTASGSIDLFTVTLGDTGPRNWSVVVMKEPFLFGNVTEILW